MKRIKLIKDQDQVGLLIKSNSWKRSVSIADVIALIYFCNGASESTNPFKTKVRIAATRCRQ